MVLSVHSRGKTPARLQFSLKKMMSDVISFKQRISNLPTNRRDQLIQKAQLEKELMLSDLAEYDKKQILQLLRMAKDSQISKKRFKFKNIGKESIDQSNIESAIVDDVSNLGDSNPLEREPLVQMEQLFKKDLNIQKSQINLSNITDSTLILDASFSIHLTNIVNTKIFCKCQQLRMHKVENCQVFIMAQSVIIEDCKGLEIKSTVDVVDFSFRNDYKSLEFDLEEFNKVYQA